jgi:hypothetical protein
MNTPEPHPVIPNSSADEPLQIGAGFNFSDPAGPLAFLYLRASHVLALAFLGLVFFFFAAAVPLAHTDIWAHLKYGQWIVAHHGVPEHGLFSPFADPEGPLENFQWLSQILFYLTYQAGAALAGGNELREIAGGVEMLRTLHGLLVVMKVGFVLLAIRRSTGSLPIATAGAALLVLLTVAASQVERPQVFGEVCFALLLWWLSGERLSRWTWLALPLLFTLWANCHESFVVGLLFLGLFWAGRIIELIERRRRGHAPSLWSSGWLWQGLAALVLAPLAAGLLNPHGLEIYSLIAKMAQHPNLRSQPEWLPLNFAPASGAAWVYLGTMVLLALSQAASPRPLPLSRFLTLIVFAIAPLYQLRLLSWWLILVPWLAGVLWHHAAAVVPRFWQRFRSVPSFRKTVFVGLILGGAVFWCGLFQLLIGRDPLPLAVSTTHATLWPLATQIKQGEEMPALDHALRAYPHRRFQGRIWVEHDLADFLVWSLPGAENDGSPQVDVLIYSHAAAFPEGHWRRYLNVLLGKPGWRSILERERVNLIVVDSRQYLDLAEQLRNDSDWEIVLDEAEAIGAKKMWSAASVKLLIAVRKHPLLKAEGGANP